MHSAKSELPKIQKYLICIFHIFFHLDIWAAFFTQTELLNSKNLQNIQDFFGPPDNQSWKTFKEITAPLNAFQVNLPVGKGI